MTTTGMVLAVLMTAWGEKVTSENAWREYPRPQLVRSNWTSLNGEWDYAVTSVTTVAGTTAFVAAAFLLHWLPFASRREYEGMLRFSMKSGDKEAERVFADIMAQYCSSYGLLGVTDAVQGEEVECSYQIRLIDPSYRKDLVSALKKDGRFASPTLIL